jgi:hypothetical protein
MPTKRDKNIKWRDHRRLVHLRGMEGRVESSRSGFIRACVIALLVILQFAIIITIPILLGQFSSLFFLVMEGCGILAILILTNSSRSMSYKFGWLSICVVLPIAGIVMFFMFGRVGKSNPLNRQIQDRFAEVDSHLIKYPEVSEIEAVATVKTTGKTGIEMEALHAVSAALLTIYDMCKAVDRGMEIREIYLVEKDGGKSGHFINKR